MRKYQALLGLGLTLSLFISAATVFAGPVPAADAKPTQSHGQGGGKPTDAGPKPEKTPGAKATEKAVERATEGKGGRTRFTFHGTVTSAGGDSLTLTSAKDGLTYTFSLTAATMINVPGKGNRGTPADITTGARVLVQATRSADTQLWTAVHIVVQTASTSDTEADDETSAHNVGTVTAYVAGESITITGSDGGASTFMITPATKILPAARAGQLAVGAQVTIIAAPSTGGDPVAKGIVVHPAGAGATATATPTP